MAIIRNLWVHHTGGTLSNQYASTRYVTFKDINVLHRARFDFKSSMGEYGGYNIAYDPKSRNWHQFRALGEESASQRGHNRDSVSICIIGNMNLRPVGSPKGIIDDLSEEHLKDIGQMMVSVMNGTHPFRVAPNTVFQLSAQRIFPHRAVSDTDCYGTGLTDSWARIVYLTEKYADPTTRAIWRLIYSFSALVTSKRVGGDPNDKREACGKVNYEHH